jgi:hypothetical protein
VGKKSGSGMNIPGRIPESLEIIFRDKLKILKFRDLLDPGSGMEIFGSGMEIFGSGIEIFGSGIGNKHPGSTTLLCLSKTSIFLI